MSNIAEILALAKLAGGKGGGGTGASKLSDLENDLFYNKEEYFTTVTKDDFVWNDDDECFTYVGALPDGWQEDCIPGFITNYAGEYYTHIVSTFTNDDADVWSDDNYVESGCYFGEGLPGRYVYCDECQIGIMSGFEMTDDGPVASNLFYVCAYGYGRDDSGNPVYEGPDQILIYAVNVKKIPGELVDMSTVEEILSEFRDDLVDVDDRLSTFISIAENTAKLPYTSSFFGWYGCAYGNGRFIVGTRNGEIACSTDGLRWTKSSIVHSGFDFDRMCYGNGIFVAAGYSSKSYMAYYSTDGITWYTAEAPPTLYNIENIVYGGGKFVAAGRGGVAYSVDGVSWNTVMFAEPTATTTYSAKCLAYGNGKFIALHSYIEVPYYSTDGVSWTSSDIDMLNIKHLIYADDKFVAFDPGNGEVWLSVDGVVWETVSATLPSFMKNCEAPKYYHNNFIVFAGNSTSDNVAYSSDGITWNTITVFCRDGSPYNSIAYGTDKIIMVGGSSQVAYSEDGCTWKTTYPVLVKNSEDVTDTVKEIVLPDTDSSQNVGFEFVRFSYGGDDELICDKTYQEIYDKISKRLLVGFIDGGEYTVLSPYFVEGIDDGGIVFRNVCSGFGVYAKKDGSFEHFEP